MENYSVDGTMYGKIFFFSAVRFIGLCRGEKITNVFFSSGLLLYVVWFFSFVYTRSSHGR